jgi:hypothetical protein
MTVTMNRSVESIRRDPPTLRNDTNSPARAGGGAVMRHGSHAMLPARCRALTFSLEAPAASAVMAR